MTKTRIPLAIEKEDGTTGIMMVPPEAVDQIVEDMREECRQRIYRAIELIDIERRALVDRLGELGDMGVHELSQHLAALPALGSKKI